MSAALYEAANAELGDAFNDLRDAVVELLAAEDAGSPGRAALAKVRLRQLVGAAGTDCWIAEGQAARAIEAMTRAARRQAMERQVLANLGGKA
jgi:hypothetical protein